MHLPGSPARIQGNDVCFGYSATAFGLTVPSTADDSGLVTVTALLNGCGSIENIHNQSAHPDRSLKK
jgi:hypothetical protein